MAEESLINGGVSDDRSVEITGEEALTKISALNRRISDLEQLNDEIIQENKGFKQQIEDLKATIKELSDENLNLKMRVDQAQSASTALGVVPPRAAELESEVSRLQHDLASAMSDLRGSAVEILDLKMDLEGMKNRERKKDARIEVMEKEKGLLMAGVEKLDRVESGLRVELLKKEKEIQVLKNSIEELEVVVVNSKCLETLKSELENKIVLMKSEISGLESSLDEKEKMICGLEAKERAILDGVNGIVDIDGDGVVEGGIGGLKQREWMVVGGSTIAAVAVMCVACYAHVARKH